MNLPRRAHALSFAFALVSICASSVRAEAEKSVFTMRYGLSRGLFRGVSENDATAAVAAYSKKLGDAYGISATPVLVDGEEALSRALESKSIDMVGLTSLEFIDQGEDQLQGPYFFAEVDGSVTEDYVLLVRADGPVRSVPDLQGRSLILSSALPAYLAPEWLEVLFHDQGLDSPQAVLASLTSSFKPTQVVLPVFFGKADACVVTRKDWKVMGELNPQVTERLRIIANSPELVVGISSFRKGFSPEAIKKITETAMMSQHETSFQQVMAIFKGGLVVTRPLTILEPTRALLARYRQVIRETGQAGEAASRKPTPPASAGRAKDASRNAR